MSGETPYFTKERVDRPWYVVDAEGQILGRLAAGVAKLLIGKQRPQFTPGQDCGGFVVVVNAAQVRFTGKKLANKITYTHSGYPGGLALRIRALPEFGPTIEHLHREPGVTLERRRQLDLQ